MAKPSGHINFSLGQGGSAISHALGSEATRSSWRDALNIIPMVDGTARRRQGSKYLAGYGSAVGPVFQHSGGVVGSRFTITLRDPDILIRDDETGALVRFTHLDLSQIQGQNVQFTPLTAADDLLVTNRKMKPIRIYRVDGVWTFIEFNIATQSDKIYDVANGNYPSCAAAHEGRLWLSGNISYPGFFWGSRSKNQGVGIKDFTFGVNDSDAVEFIVDGSASNIISMDSRQGLLLVSEDGFRVVKSDGPIITPSDIQINSQNQIPVADAKSTTKGNVAVHLGTSGRALHLSFFNWQNQAWTTNTREPLDEQLLDGENLVQVAVVEEYFDTMWLLSSTGRLFSFKVLGEGKYAWGKHDVSGHVRAISAQVGAVGSGVIMAVQRGSELTLERISRHDTEHSADCWVQLSGGMLPSGVRQPGCIVESTADQSAYTKYIGSAVTPDALVAATPPPALPEPTGTTASEGSGEGGSGGSGGSGTPPAGTGGDSGTVLALPRGYPWHSVSLPNHTFLAGIPNVPVQIADLGVYLLGQPPTPSPDTARVYLSWESTKWEVYSDDGSGAQQVDQEEKWPMKIHGVLELPKNALYGGAESFNPSRGINFEYRLFKSDDTHLRTEIVPLRADGVSRGANHVQFKSGFVPDNSPMPNHPMGDSGVWDAIQSVATDLKALDGGVTLLPDGPNQGAAGNPRCICTMVDSIDDAYYVYFEIQIHYPDLGFGTEPLLFPANPGQVKLIISAYNDTSTVGVTHAMDASFLPQLITVNM